MSHETVVQLVAKGIELINKIPAPVLEDSVQFLEGIVSGNKRQALRAANSLLVSAFWHRPRG